MFENLVECQKNKKRDKKWSFFIVTAVVWLMAFTGAIIGGIFLYDAQLNEQLSLITMVLTPPPPPPPPPPAGGMPKPQPTKPTPIYRNDIAVDTVPDKIEMNSNETTVNNTSNTTGGGGIPGGLPNGIPGGVVGGLPEGIVGGTGDIPVKVVQQTQIDVPPPPPQPSIIKRSEGVIRGNKLVEVKPEYPMIARTAHISGDVQVEIIISEEGQVIGARVLSGPPMLQKAAVEAARQWRFNPTLLNNAPVKVQGVLTFRFTL